jgi:hypothetical protein
MKSSKIWSSLALFLAIQGAQADQQVLRTPSNRFPLDELVVVTHQPSGQVKCCPPGFDFDGSNCVPGAPICPENSVLKGDKCISTSKPVCREG